MSTISTPRWLSVDVTPPATLPDGMVVSQWTELLEAQLPEGLWLIDWQVGGPNSHLLGAELAVASKHYPSIPQSSSENDKWGQTHLYAMTSSGRSLVRGPVSFFVRNSPLNIFAGAMGGSSRSVSLHYHAQNLLGRPGSVTLTKERTITVVPSLGPSKRVDLFPFLPPNLRWNPNHISSTSGRWDGGTVGDTAKLYHYIVQPGSPAHAYPLCQYAYPETFVYSLNEPFTFIAPPFLYLLNLALTATMQQFVLVWEREL